MTSELRGRQLEQDTLDRLLSDVRDGQSRVLVLRGEAGSGKTVLLDGLARRAVSTRLLRASGVESESEIAYSALQQLCAPVMDHVERLPEPQRAALTTAFGLSAGPPPEQLRVGVAVLGLFAAASTERAVVAIVDDVQWIDAMSRVILGFVARRLSAEPVALVFAVRSPGDDDMLTDLPQLRIEGLSDADARALLDSVLPGPVDPRVKDQIVAEARGNPLALRELPRGLSPADLAFGFGDHGASPLASRVEEEFGRRIAALPPATRTVLLAAALEPVGDAPLLWRAMERLGVSPEAAAAAQAEGLIEFGTRVRFPHPLVRSSVWHSGRAAELRAVHAALAEATDPQADPDRRAWHRAHAALGPDDEVAAELADSADRALARGGFAAAAALLERAAQLTTDQARRGGLLVSAAGARADAGAYAEVPGLLAAAELGPLDALQLARAERLRAKVAFLLSHGRDTVPRLLAAARRLDALDPVGARDTYLMALSAAIQAGRYGGEETRVVAETARKTVSPGGTLPDLLLAGVTAWILDGRTAALPLLNRALDAMGSASDLPLFWLAGVVANEMLRYDLAYQMGEQAVRYALDLGALSLLPGALAVWANSLLDAGRLTDADDMMNEINAVARATGSSAYQFGLMLAAYRGPEQQAVELIGGRLRDAVAVGDGWQHAVGNIALAMLNNGLGKHASALAAAREATAYPDLALHHWGLRELVEAAAYAGDRTAAISARDRLAERTADTPTPAALGVQAVADALAGPPEHAEDRFREAVGHLATVETTINLCRARLLYGEWLSRENRHAEARAELRSAYQAFSDMGAMVFAQRAGQGLAGLGEAVLERPSRQTQALTSQEATIAQLAVAGRTNPEIGAVLFLSPRTVEWHLRKVYSKFGISSRRELAAAMRDR